MLRRETTLVLGAGASKIFGLPLGVDLKKNIASSIDLYFDDWGNSLKRGDYEIAEAFRVVAKRSTLGNGSINPYVQASREIAEALPVCGSIDDYIERHAGHDLYAICAKIGIAHCILNSERKSALRANPDRLDPPDITTFSGSWLDRFLQLITQGCRSDSLSEALGKVKVINFNYDRCFEHFVFYWLRRVYRLTDEAAGAAIACLEIVHPYGSIGYLPSYHHNGAIPFGYTPSASELVHIADGIRTYSESTVETERAASINNAVQSCTNFVVLGFAFHQQNMNLLQCTPFNPPSTRRVYASAVEVSEPKWEIVRRRISEALRVPEERLYTYKVNESCEKLFEEYSDVIAS